MPGIFNDEQRERGPIWSNPYGTKPILSLDGVASCLKWPALRRNSRLASDKMDLASTATIIVHGP